MMIKNTYNIYMMNKKIRRRKKRRRNTHRYIKKMQKSLGEKMLVIRCYECRIKYILEKYF